MGGNLWPEVNSVVPQELVEATIRSGLSLVGLSGIRFERVGSRVGRVTGDVDIAVNRSDVARRLQVHVKEGDAAFWTKFTEHLKKSPVDKFKVVKGLSQVSLLVPLVDQQGNQQFAVGTDGGKLASLGFVQLDLMVGNAEWMKGVVSGASEKSKYKSVYRNLFLAAFVKHLRWDQADDGSSYRRFVLNFRDGLKVVRVTTYPGLKKFTSHLEKIITRSPDTLAKLLFGAKVRWSDIADFEGVFERFQSLSISPALKRTVADEFSSTLRSKGLPLPEELTGPSSNV